MHQCREAGIGVVFCADRPCRLVGVTGLLLSVFVPWVRKRDFPSYLIAQTETPCAATGFESGVVLYNGFRHRLRNLQVVKDILLTARSIGEG